MRQDHLLTHCQVSGASDEHIKSVWIWTFSSMCGCYMKWKTWKTCCVIEKFGGVTGLAGTNLTCWVNGPFTHGLLEPVERLPHPSASTQRKVQINTTAGSSRPRRYHVVSRVSALALELALDCFNSRIACPIGWHYATLATLFLLFRDSFLIRIIRIISAIAFGPLPHPFNNRIRGFLGSVYWIQLKLD